MSFWVDPIGVIHQWLLGLLMGWGVPEGLATSIGYLIGAGLLATVPLILTIFLIWAERKILGRVQDRLGPNRVGPWGIFQTFADMVKIFTKELITPQGVDWVAYNLAPIITTAAVIMLWAVIPFTSTIYGVDFNMAVLYVLAIGSFGEMGVVLAGWGSNNKYAMLAAFRAVAQLISYEVPMVLSLMVPVMFAGSLSMRSIVQAQDVWYIVMAPLPALIFFVSSVAEVGRAPFDLTESESELVAGFNIEYSGLKFGFFYVADFLHAFTVALLFTVMFLGGWRGPGAAQFPLLGVIYFMVKTALVWFVTLLMRGALPRFRIDQMMDLNWKFLTPLSLVIVMATALVDKIFPQDPFIVRILALLAANAVVGLGANYVLDQRAKRHPRLVVAKTPRPVAHYAKQPAQSDPGAQ